MWGFNDWVKLCSQCLISLHVLTGLLFVGYGLYVVLRPWGNAEKDVYQAIGACLVLFGTCLTTVSVFGFEAIGAQVKRFGG